MANHMNNGSPDGTKTIVEQIRALLAKLGYSQLNSIHCSANGNDVVLSGKLESFYLKQVAQTVAMKVPGVRNVRNEIEVT